MTSAETDAALSADTEQAYWAALETGDAPAALAAAVRARDGGVPVAQLLTGLIGRAQERVGELWLTDRWTVAQEHRATAVGEEVVAALTAALAPPAGDGPVAVVLCADGEWHTLPSRIVAGTLRAAGWQVTYLGASVPARHLSQLLQDVGPDLVAVSCSLPLRLRHARQIVETTRDAGVPVVVGGRGFGPGGRWADAVGATAWLPDADTALRLVREGRLPRFVDPAPPVAAPDDAVADVEAAREDVVEAAMRRMAGALPDVAGYDEHQLARTREDVGYILDFLTAALFVDDAALFTDFVGWLDTLLAARGVPTPTLRAGLRTVDDLLGERVPQRAHDVLAAGIAALA